MSDKVADARQLTQQLEAKLMGYLARREYSSKELRQKLTTQFPVEHIDKVLAEFQSKGLQSDFRFAETLIRSRARQGYGPRRILSELKAKGVGSTAISQALEANAQDWFELARACHARRFKEGPAPDSDIKSRSRQIRFLQYRGFDQEQIQFALSSRASE